MTPLKWTSISEEKDGDHLGMYEVFPPFTEMHNHDFYELFLVADGELLHLREGCAPERVRQGDLRLVRPEDTHGFGRIAQKEACLVNLAFPRRRLRAALGFLGLPEEAALSGHRREAHLSTPECVSIQDRISRGVDAAGRRALVADWLARVLGGDGGGDGTRIPEWLRELCVAMRRRENFLAGLPRLHHLSGHTPEHVARSFRACLGVTPSGFVNQRRIGFACTLLTETNLPVTEIAAEAGFESQSYFNRVFRRETGQTPLDYRRLCPAGVVFGVHARS